MALRGVIYKGTFTSFQSSPNQTWTELDITNEAVTPPFTQAEGGTISGGDTQTIDLLGGDLLLIPQRITRICGFSMTWTHENGTSETVNIPLDFETGVTHWEAGKSYNYKAKIRDESTVIFNVTIKDWTEEDYTVDW